MLLCHIFNCQLRRDALSYGRFFISKMDEDLKNLTRSEVKDMLDQKNGI